jgi:hypothetical protein
MKNFPNFPHSIQVCVCINLRADSDQTINKIKFLVFITGPGVEGHYSE